MIFMTKTPLSLILEPVPTNLKEEYTLTFIELKDQMNSSHFAGRKTLYSKPTQRGKLSFNKAFCN